MSVASFFIPKNESCMHCLFLYQIVFSCPKRYSSEFNFFFFNWVLIDTLDPIQWLGEIPNPRIRRFAFNIIIGIDRKEHVYDIRPLFVKYVW